MGRGTSPGAPVSGERVEARPGRVRHEVWDYDDARRVQRLVRLIALCPACHEVKHLGLAAKRGRHRCMNAGGRS